MYSWPVIKFTKFDEFINSKKGNLDWDNTKSWLKEHKVYKLFSYLTQLYCDQLQYIVVITGPILNVSGQ